jgi:hypothetical protein
LFCTYGCGTNISSHQILHNEWTNNKFWEGVETSWVTQKIWTFQTEVLCKDPVIEGNWEHPKVTRAWWLEHRREWCKLRAEREEKARTVSHGKDLSFLQEKHGCKE